MAISDGYLGYMKVSVAEAKNKLTQLLKAVEKGQQITICRRGVAIAEIVRSSDSPRKLPKLGTMRDKIIIHDPNWANPMTDEEFEAFIDGRY
jgi:prevent-host-death family protein